MGFSRGWGVAPRSCNYFIAALVSRSASALVITDLNAGGGGPVPDFCHQFLPATDIPGPNLGSLGGTADNAACLAACQAIAGCNAAIRVDGNGGCFFKNVDGNTVVPFHARGLTSYVDCEPGALELSLCLGAYFVGLMV